MRRPHDGLGVVEVDPRRERPDLAVPDECRGRPAPRMRRGGNRVVVIYWTVQIPREPSSTIQKPRTPIAYAGSHHHWSEVEGRDSRGFGHTRDDPGLWRSW